MNLTLKVLESECTSISELMLALYNQKYQTSFDEKQNTLLVKYITQDDVSKIRAIFNSQGISFIPVASADIDTQTIENVFSFLIQNCTEKNRKIFLKSISKMLKYESFLNEKACAQLLETFCTLISENYIPHHILLRNITLIRQELELKYFAQNASNVSVGDIIICNFGIGLKEEFTGPRVCALVCNKDSIGQIFVLPIVKRIRNIPKNLTYELISGINATFNDDYYFGGIVLLNRGVYINPLRINGIVGKVSNDALIQVLYELPNIYDFTQIFEHDLMENDILSLDNFDMEPPDSSIIEGENEDTGEKIQGEDVATVEEDSSIKDTFKVKGISAKENLLIHTFSDALDGFKMTSGKVPGERIEWFMDAIKMPKTDNALLCSFLVSIVNTFHSYDALAQKLLVCYDFHSDKTPEQLAKELKASFNAWIKQYPDFKEKYPNISLPALLRVFNRYYTP